MTKTFVLLMSLAAAPLAAQSPLIGSWQISYPGAVRMLNGVESSSQATGVLTITAKGDSLFGTLAPDSVAGKPRRPSVQMAGQDVNRQGVFKSENKVKMNINGEESQATVLLTWTLKVADDKLQGTLERHLAGQEAANTGSPVIGTRIKK